MSRFLMLRSPRPGTYITHVDLEHMPFNLKSVKSPLGLLRERWSLERRKFLLRGRYTTAHSNHDIDRHLHEAAAWLCRAQDAGKDRGFSYGAQLGSGFLPSYPETTGYIIPTLLRLAKLWQSQELRNRAVEAGDWEISVQLENGAVMGGRVDAQPSPAIFNTGQVLLGWTSLYDETRDERFRVAAERAADWMLAMQDPDGRWIRGNSPLANPATTLYNVRAAWGLARYGHIASSKRHLDGALRNAAFALSEQKANGWYANNCLNDATRPLTHTIAYTMQGLYELGVLCKRNDLRESARRCADGLLLALEPDGFLPGRIDSDFSGTVSWCCLTGSAQVAIVFWRLAEWTGDGRYAKAAHSLNRYLMSRHDIENPDPVVRGALAGSWPIWGAYGQFLVLNWAVKFFIDALLEEKRESGAIADDPSSLG